MGSSGTVVLTKLLLSTYNVSMCSESFWCGSVEIHYPFYLANATEAIADYSGNIFSCGYTDLSISCKLEGQTWIPTIRLDGDDYTVENISYHYDHQTILLVDSDVLGGAGGDCPAVRHEVSFDETWLHSSSYTTITSPSSSAATHAVPCRLNSTHTKSTARSSRVRQVLAQETPSWSL